MVVFIQHLYTDKLLYGGHWPAQDTERRGRVFNTPASSGGPGFKSRPRLPAILSEGFVVFLSPSRRIPGSTLKLGHGRFLPNPFQFICYPVIDAI
jgi:hypothetical protein